MFAFRALRKSPAYTFIALVTLALGIGVNTAMVSLIEGVLFRSLPFSEPESLVEIQAATHHGELHVFSEVEQRELRSQAGSFEHLLTFSQVLYSFSDPGQPAERLPAVLASAELFTLLKVHPLLGRTFSEEETKQGNNNVVLLSHAFWQQRFGANPDAVGKTLRLDGQSVTIIGVMPPTCDLPSLWGQASLFRPLNFTHDQLESRDYKAFTVLGRLPPETTPEKVSAALAGLAALQQKEHPQSYAGLRYRVLPLRDALTHGTTRRLYWLLFGLSGFVLLIACANLANLQLARATASLRDLAIRSALGASRWRLIAHQLGECLLVSLAGGVLGLVVAKLLIRALESRLLAETDTPLALDVEVLLSALAVSLGAGILFGIVPAWLVSRMDLNSALKQGSRGSTSGRGHQVVRNSLIVFQVALALVLLSGAAILQRGFAQFLERPCGWDTSRVLVANLPLPESRFESEPKRIELYQKVERRLALLPGVEHAALASSLPLNALEGERSISLEGQETGAGARNPRAYHVMVTPDFFAAMGIPLLEGRLFPVSIKDMDPLVIIINESLARHLWPGQSPLGKRIRSDDAGYITWAEVIGVVRDVETVANVSEPSTRFQIYKPMVHEPWAGNFIVLRSQAPGSLANDLRRAVAEVDADLAVDGVSTVNQRVQWQQRDLHLIGELLTAFAVLGLALAAVGLYGVVSHSVAQRTGEFGIRLALGAQPSDVLSLVLRHGLQLSAIGLAAGLLGAGFVGRLLASLMPRLASVDPLTLTGVSTILILVALLACWFPARRATKVDPMITLRSE